jgi:NAD-dependent dihydropyrimidine dehydrogenase PreA subunit
MKYLADVTTLAYVAEKCVGCGRCVEVCPRGVFEMKGKRATITDRDLCMECGACARNCDFGAVSVNAGVGCAAAIINSMFRGGEPTCGCSDAGGSAGCC